MDVFKEIKYKKTFIIGFITNLLYPHSVVDVFKWTQNTVFVCIEGLTQYHLNLLAPFPPHQPNNKNLWLT